MKFSLHFLRDFKSRE